MFCSSLARLPLIFLIFCSSETAAPKRVVKTSVSNFLKGFESLVWEMRLESSEAVNQILYEVSNKNLVMLLSKTLTTIDVAVATGPAVEKASKLGDTCQALKIFFTLYSNSAYLFYQIFE
ncbi:unnamed protein product [Arabidopsis halleri]